MSTWQYFKFTVDSAKKLSKQDLENIFISEIKNGTLDSTLCNAHYAMFLHLIDLGYSLNDINLKMSPSYRIIENHTYIELVHYADDELHDVAFKDINKLCSDEINFIFDNSDEQDIKTLRDELNGICNDHYFDDIDKIKSRFDLAFHTTCSHIYGNYISNIDDAVKFCIDDVNMSSEKQLLMKHYKRLTDFFTKNFENILNKTKKYSPKDYNEYKDLYNSLKV